MPVRSSGVGVFGSFTLLTPGKLGQRPTSIRRVTEDESVARRELDHRELLRRAREGTGWFTTVVDEPSLEPTHPLLSLGAPLIRTELSFC